MQTARRTSPYPWTWEVPAIIAGSLMLMMLLTLQVARAVANLIAGGQWTWPPRAEVFSAAPGLLRGDASAGLGEGLAEAASSEQLWIWIVVLEIAALTAFFLAIRWVLARFGPGRILGMASANEAEWLLGASRLRRNAAVIRPDLYGSGTKP